MVEPAAETAVDADAEAAGTSTTQRAEPLAPAPLPVAACLRLHDRLMREHVESALHELQVRITSYLL